MNEDTREAYAEAVLDIQFDPMAGYEQTMALRHQSRYFTSGLQYAFLFDNGTGRETPYAKFYGYLVEDSRTRHLIAEGMDSRLRQRGFGAPHKHRDWVGNETWTWYYPTP